MILFIQSTIVGYNDISTIGRTFKLRAIYTDDFKQNGIALHWVFQVRISTYLEIMVAMQSDLKN